MKKINFKFILASLLCCLWGFQTIHASNRPNWSVSPNQFQYSMNITAVINSYCTELGNDSNILGAFINGTCRGVVKTNTTVGGHKLAYLLVYSNLSSGDSVSFKFYNYVTDSIYTANVKVPFSDNGSFGTNIKPYVVKTNNPPTAIIFSSTLFPENDTIQQVVAQLSAVDPDAAPYQVYSLVSGAGSTDNSKFNILSNNFVLDSTLNYYKQDSLHVRLRVTDKGGCYFEQAFVLGVKHTFHPPTNLALTNSIVSENHKTPYFISNFITTNYDMNDPYSYALVAGLGDSDNVHFTISNDSLIAISNFNYEKKNAYGIRVRVTDLNGGGTFEKSFVIHVKNDNDPPVLVILSTNRFHELQPIGSQVAILSTKDLDGGINKRKYTYTFSNQGTNDNLAFSISADTLKSTLIFDYELKKSYSIYLTTTDTTGASWTGNYQIMILDTLDTPTGIVLSNDTITEQLPKGTFIGSLSTIDDNGAAIHKYTLVSGAGSSDNSNFNIVGDSLVANVVFDFERKSNYSIRIRTTLVNGLFFEQVFAVIIKNNPPSNFTLSNNRVYELLPAKSFVGTFNTTDVDPTDKFTYTLSNQGTNDNSNFSISNDTLYTAVSFDYELKNKYNIIVTNADSLGFGLTRSFTISVRDTLDTPTNLVLSNDSVFQHKKLHTFIGVFSTIDDNGNAQHTYSLVAGNGSTDNASFKVASDSLYTNAIFDFETKSSYSIRVRTALVNNRYLDTLFTIHIKENNYEKPIAYNDSGSVNEGVPVGTQVLTLKTPSDSDLTQTFTFRLLTPNVPFALDKSTGILTVNNTIDFHQQQFYTLKYVVYNSEPQPLNDTAIIKVTILPVEEATLPVNNYVSPNGDGKNDAFTLISPEVYADFELTIYNSSGLVVYTKKGYHNEWVGDGLPAGVYYYTFIGDRTYKGNIVLAK